MQTELGRLYVELPALDGAYKARLIVSESDVDFPSEECIHGRS
jgi:hypothetical protein